jgi:hypothetical protein
MNDEGVKKNNTKASDGQENISYGSTESLQIALSIRRIEENIAVIEKALRDARKGKWRSYDVPDDFHDMLIAEVELSSGSKDYFLCVIDDRGEMVDPEGNDLGWDYECISRWVPFDEFLTWANGSES